MYKKDSICPFCRRPFGLPLPPINEELRKLVLRIRNQLANGGNDVAVDAEGIVQDVRSSSPPWKTCERTVRTLTQLNPLPAAVIPLIYAR